LEQYREQCEQKLEQAGYELPITPESQTSQSSGQELKRQLALREQDLNYAKGRAEKAVNECEQVRRDLGDKIEALEEEKNALLDYIEEMQMPESEFVAKMQQQIADLKLQHSS